MPDPFYEFTRSVSGHTNHEEWVGYPVQVCVECGVLWPCDIERAARASEEHNA